MEKNTIIVNGVEIDADTLADAIWQGCKYMADEVNEEDCPQERKKFLIGRIQLDLFYHYIILDFDIDEAKAMAEESLKYEISKCHLIDDEEDDEEAERFPEEEAKKLKMYEEVVKRLREEHPLTDSLNEASEE